MVADARICGGVGIRFKLLALADGALQVVDAPEPDAGPPLARDTFTRTLDAGLGAAEIGGPWSFGDKPGEIRTRPR